MITHDPTTWPSIGIIYPGAKIWCVCRAIARAEGANEYGSAPDRLNNPGDLSKGDEHGQKVLGYLKLPDGEEAIHFLTKDGGWNALYAKINNILEGHSHVYTPQMTWRQIAKEYAGDSLDWANNVARELGVSPDSTFADYFAVAQLAAGA
jgi:hypothetical protein